MADLSNMRKQYHFWPSDVGDGLDAWDVDRLIELAEVPVGHPDPPTGNALSSLASLSPRGRQDS